MGRWACTSKCVSSTSVNVIAVSALCQLPACMLSVYMLMAVIWQRQRYPSWKECTELKEVSAEERCSGNCGNAEHSDLSFFCYRPFDLLTCLCPFIPCDGDHPPAATLRLPSLPRCHHCKVKSILKLNPPGRPPHPNIVCLLELFRDPKERLHMVFEHMASDVLQMIENQKGAIGVRRSAQAIALPHPGI